MQWRWEEAGSRRKTLCRFGDGESCSSLLVSDLVLFYLVSRFFNVEEIYSLKSLWVSFR